ncbi:MAG: hypothetical protein QM811_19060 [Pirellulales bacterium]
MLKLTREVRFAVPPLAAGSGVRNGHGGYPAVEGLGRPFVVQVSLTGPQSEDSGYVRNIVEIDSQVRAIVIPIISRDD